MSRDTLHLKAFVKPDFKPFIAQDTTRQENNPDPPGFEKRVKEIMREKGYQRPAAERVARYEHNSKQGKDATISEKDFKREVKKLMEAENLTEQEAASRLARKHKLAGGGKKQGQDASRQELLNKLQEKKALLAKYESTGRRDPNTFSLAQHLKTEVNNLYHRLSRLDHGLKDTGKDASSDPWRTGGRVIHVPTGKAGEVVAVSASGSRVVIKFDAGGKKEVNASEVKKEGRSPRSQLPVYTKDANISALGRRLTEARHRAALYPTEANLKASREAFKAFKAAQANGASDARGDPLGTPTTPGPITQADIKGLKQRIAEWRSRGDKKNLAAGERLLKEWQQKVGKDHVHTKDCDCGLT